jgi:hypothetical protein
VGEHAQGTWERAAKVVERDVKPQQATSVIAKESGIANDSIIASDSDVANDSIIANETAIASGKCRQGSAQLVVCQNKRLQRAPQEVRQRSSQLIAPKPNLASYRPASDVGKGPGEVAVGQIHDFKVRELGQL